MDALQRPVQRRRIENVPLHDLGRRLHTGSQLVGIAGQAAEPHALLFQQGDQPPADVAAAAREQDDRLVGGLGGRHGSGIPVVTVRKAGGDCL